MIMKSIYIIPDITILILRIKSLNEKDSVTYKSRADLQEIGKWKCVIAFKLSHICCPGINFKKHISIMIIGEWENYNS